jgi:hypothetical protein
VCCEDATIFDVFKTKVIRIGGFLACLATILIMEDWQM